MNSPTMTSEGRPASHTDLVRKETLDILKCLDPGPETIHAIGVYASSVDDKNNINNFAESIQQITSENIKFVNPKFWSPLHAQMNIEKLVEQFGFNWPKKAEQMYENVKEMLDEIDQSFQDKGLKTSRIPNTKQYKPNNSEPSKTNNSQQYKPSNSISTAKAETNPILEDERLKNIDPQIAERILNEVLEKKQSVCWDDIAGLKDAKEAINEIVVYPMLNPKIFKGLLAPAKGLLLFGPPGTGKTLIGKCIACESKATFFAISASSLTSKWIGEGEKMVRALFAVARVLQPSVVFIDEIDSLLTQRTDGEHDSSRKMKTEFLVQFDGVSCETDDKILIIGATNRPQELDEAARRRFTKRLYIPLPDKNSREEIVRRLMNNQNHELTDEDISYIGDLTKGYSGADMNNLCKEAAMGPIRTVLSQKIVGSVQAIDTDNLPAICKKDFDTASKQAKATVSQDDLSLYDLWNTSYGSVGIV